MFPWVHLLGVRWTPSGSYAESYSVKEAITFDCCSRGSHSAFWTLLNDSRKGRHERVFLDRENISDACGSISEFLGISGSSHFGMSCSKGTGHVCPWDMLLSAVFQSEDRCSSYKSAPITTQFKINCNTLNSWGFRISLEQMFRDLFSERSEKAKFPCYYRGLLLAKSVFKLLYLGIHIRNPSKVLEMIIMSYF